MINNNLTGRSDRYDRQRRVYGEGAIENMHKAKVFISNIDGHAIEILKDIILSGVGNVVIFNDHKLVTKYDLGYNWFLNESDINKDRTITCIERMQELNPDVNIQMYDGEITSEYLQDFTAVVFINNNIHTIKTLADELHDKTKIIVTYAKGIIGYVCCDFGSSYTVLEADSEQYKQFIIESITSSVSQPTLNLPPNSDSLNQNSVEKHRF